MSIQKNSCQNTYNHKEHDHVLSTPSLSYNPVHYFYQNKSSPYIFNRFNAIKNREDRQKFFNEYNAYLFLKNDVHPYESTQGKQSFDQTFIYFNGKEIPANFAPAKKTVDDSKIHYVYDNRHEDIEYAEREKYVKKISFCEQKVHHLSLPKCEICRNKWVEEIQSR